VSGSDFYAYVGNDPTDKTDPTGLAALFANLQAVLIFGSYGGRVDVSIGVDDRKGPFLVVSAGGPNDPKKIDEGGLQGGVGISGGLAKNSNVLTTPAVVTDFDAGILSGSINTNDPPLPGKDNGSGGTGGKGKGSDTAPNAVAFGGGFGLGGSEIKTTPIVSCTGTGGCSKGSQSDPPPPPPPPPQHVVPWQDGSRSPY
jgi:hypothetical protein